LKTRFLVLKRDFDGRRTSATAGRYPVSALFQRRDRPGTLDFQKLV
jgi:prephenate dehydratase